MKLSPQADNFFTLVNILKAMERPEGKDLRGYYADDVFVMDIVTGKKEAAFVLCDYVSLTISVHDVTTPNIQEVAFHVPDYPSNDQLTVIANTLVGYLNQFDTDVE